MDAHANLAHSTLASPPDGTSGTELTVATGHGARFPTAPFNVTVWPAGVSPTYTNAEIMRVTNVASDTFTVTRAQEGTSARTFSNNSQIAATITAKTQTDAEYGAHGIINVKDPVYGAVGDGVTDDTAAIQAADAAAALIGGVVYFPPGTYLNGSSPYVPLTPSSNVTWQGAGYDSVLKVPSPDATGKHCISISDASTGWTIRRLRLEGPQSGDISALGLSYGLGINGQDRTSRIDFLGATVEDVWIRNFPNQAIRITEGAANLFVVRPRVYNCGAGIAISHGAQDIVVDHPEIEHIWSQGMFVDDATTGDTPATAAACDRISVVAPRIRDAGYDPLLNTWNAIAIAGSHRVTVVAPDIADVGGAGVVIGSDNGEIVSTGCSIVGGSVSRTGRESVVIQGAGNAVVGVALVDADVAAVGARFVKIAGTTVGGTSIEATRNKIVGCDLSVLTTTVDYGVVFDGTGGGCVGNDVSDTRAVGLSARLTREDSGASGNTTNGGGVSPDRGDASVTLEAGTDAPTQLFATDLTANRTVTLSGTGAYHGARFRVVRTGLGAFTLDVGGLKTIASATAAFVDVEFNNTAWILTAYGAL